MKANVIWTRNGLKIAAISLAIVMHHPGPFYVEIDYLCEKVPMRYKVRLVAVPSNLGRGEIWYFVCPSTNKRCRKLYLVGGLFLHRTAHPEALYELQTWSKATRTEAKHPVYQGLYADHIYQKIYIKYFKRTYKGKPTKRYLRLLKGLEKLDRNRV